MVLRNLKNYNASSIKNILICHKLWSSVFVDIDGQVYICCHCKPSSIGNIYIHNIEQIWNSEKLKYYRKLCVEQKLYCLRYCSLLKDSECKIDLNNYKNLKNFLKESSYPQYIEARITTACNLRCVMCVSNFQENYLPLEILVKHINFNKIKRLILQGGEPLLYKEIKHLFEIASTKEIKIDLLTNGMLINEEWAQILALHSHMVYISLNAASKETHERINRGSSWEKVIYNIKMLKKFRETYRTNLIIHGHMTIVLQNLKEIHLFMKNYRHLGFDRINFGYDRSVVAFLKRHPYIHAKLKNTITNTYLSLPSQVRRNVYSYRLELLGLLSHEYSRFKSIQI